MIAALLATKCPHCKTTFKVANDQLKLQSGLVRCGICHQVFNGIENLAAADHVTNTIKINTPVTTYPKPADPPARPAINAAEQEFKLHEPEFDLFTEFNIASESPTESEPKIEPKIEPTFEPENVPGSIGEQFFPSMLRDEFQSTEAPADFHAKVQALLDADLKASGQLHDMQEIAGEEDMEEIILEEPHDLDQTVVPRKKIGSLRGMLPGMSDEDSSLDDDNPDHDDEIAKLKFIRQANSKKWMTRFFAFGSFLLLIALIGQTVYQFRDLIASTYPPAKAPLVSLCKLVNCQINLPAQLDAISYEADELHTLPRDKTFEFSMLMRNHSSLAQAWPDIELTLKDSKKQVVLKKVFQPSEYLSNASDVLNGLVGGGEQAVKVYFVLDKVQASDYVVAIFYP